jgi:DNA-binding CsgD family transcriptional regulator
VATALFSRGDETAVLDRVLTDAARSEGRAVVLEGPAGIGKTALLEYLRDEAADRGLRVLTARASELDRAFAHGVVHQLFEPALAAAGPDERDRLFTGAAGRAAALFTGTETTDEQGYAVQLGLYWLTVNLAERRPLLLLVDDLQWADLPTLRFLEYLGRRLDGLPVAVVATVRTAEPDTPVELLAEITHGPSATVLRPAPLDSAAVADVLGRTLGTLPGPGFTAAARQATGGNPLLVTLLAREAAAAHLTGTDAEGDRLTALGAPGVAPTVLRRLRPLGPDAAAVARAAAVAGERGSLDDIVALADRDRGTVVRTLEILAAAAVLQPGSWTFVHPLVKAAIVGSCPPELLSAMHRAAAARLRERGARPAEIALHWLATAPAGDPQAVEDLVRSAAAAAADDAHEAGTAHLRRALLEPPEPDRLPGVLLALGELEVRLQLPDGPGRLRRVLTLLPPGNDAARARAALGNHLVHTDPVAALDEFRRGLEQVTDPALKLRLEAFTLEALILPEAFPEARAAAFAAARADPSPSSIMLAHLAVKEACSGRPAPLVQAMAERALADGTLMATVGPASTTWNLLTHAMRFTESAQRCREVLEQGEELVAEHGLREARFFVDQSWGYWHRDFGSVATGAARSLLCLENVRDLGFDLTVPVAAAVAVENLVHRDRLDDAAAVMELPLGAAEHTFMEPFALTARGYLRLVQGRLDEAEADLRRVVAFDAHRGWVIPNATRGRLRLAEVLAARGRREEARELAEQDIAVAAAAQLPGSVGMAMRVKALACPHDEAIAVLTDAVALLEGTPYRLEAGWAQHDLGARLNRAGDRAAAREPLRRALDAAARTESSRLGRYTRRELEAAGARPRRDHVTGTQALTAAERRVADLALEGLTNRQIAESLWVTLKTVEIHLSRTYAKLGVSSRKDLPAAMGAVAG